MPEHTSAGGAAISSCSIRLTRYQADLKCSGHHIKDHAAQNEVDATSATIHDSIQGACLPGQVVFQVQAMKVPEHLVANLPDGGICDLHQMCHIRVYHVL